MVDSCIISIRSTNGNLTIAKYPENKIMKVWGKNGFKIRKSPVFQILKSSHNSGEDFIGFMYIVGSRCTSQVMLNTEQAAIPGFTFDDINKVLISCPQETCDLQLFPFLYTAIKHIPSPPDLVDPLLAFCNADDEHTLREAIRVK